MKVLPVCQQKFFQRLTIIVVGLMSIFYWIIVYIKMILEIYCHNKSNQYMNIKLPSIESIKLFFFVYPVIAVLLKVIQFFVTHKNK